MNLIWNYEKIFESWFKYKKILANIKNINYESKNVESL